MAVQYLEFGTGAFVVLGSQRCSFDHADHQPRLSFGSPPHYDVSAIRHIGDLRVGAPVSMAGRGSGRVGKIDFDTKEYKAAGSCGEFQIQPDPDDSDASILHAGLLAQVSLVSRPRRRNLPQGPRIKSTLRSPRSFSRI